MNNELEYIVNSKLRCQRFGLDPRIIPAFSTIMPDDQLTQKKTEYDEILTVTHLFVNKILTILKGIPYIIIITDEIGTVLEMAGDETIKKTTQELGIKAGIQFREEESGTNTINLSLLHDQPIQLIGHDHYHEFLQNTACYSVPLYLKDVNNLLGTITLMTSVDLHSPFILAMLGMVVDSIERELLLRRKNSHLNSELEAYRHKLEFIHFISHEIRNPLTIINAYVSILRGTETRISSEGLTKITGIQNNVKVIDYELTHIIETEQMLANELCLKKEPVFLQSTCHDVVSLMMAKAQTQCIEFTFEINVGKHEQILGNYTGLRLIISNLLSNAIKYSDQNGIVTFKVNRENEFICLMIEDHGIGITPDQVDLLFKKYGKFNDSRNGLGIGLYIVKQLVDSFQGTLYIESEVGCGTTVRVMLPCYKQISRQQGHSE